MDGKFARRALRAAKSRLRQPYRRVRRRATDLYLGVRHLLPTHRTVTCAGILVGRKRPDGMFPDTRQIVSADDYESALVAALLRHVRADDRVVVVGGGLGVTAAVAARQARAVTCYEGSRAFARIVTETAHLNGLDNLTVVEAIVGADLGVYSGDKAVRTIAAEDIAPCDVLEMDCEGAEAVILPCLTQRPRVVIVETHGFLGAPTEAIAGLLRGLGYVVEDMGVAETRLRDSCLEQDVMCLVATRDAAA